MEACSFDEENTILDPPNGMRQRDCESIPVWMGFTPLDVPVTISCWKVTQRELEEIQRTGRVYLVVMGHGMPAVYLTTDKPMG